MKPELSAAEQDLRDAALEYHRAPTRGKIAVTPTKPLSNQRDLSLAYSPGVAYACLAIAEDPSLAAEYTSRANLVGVVTNGTAVLGLGEECKVERYLFEAMWPRSTVNSRNFE